jgi:hypothetical protein
MEHAPPVTSPALAEAVQDVQRVEAGPRTGTAPLTICSVSFHGAPYLNLSEKLTRVLNPGEAVKRWVVVENTPAGEASRVRKSDSRFDLLPGVKPVEGKGKGSYQHGKALNRALAGIDTRFLLLLDPDFFIVQRDWICRVLAHMEKRRLSFFGAPWHPRWYRKWRYFPCAHCLFIDLERVDVAELDFRPDITRQPSPYVSMFHAELEWMWARGEKLSAWKRILRHPRIALEEDRLRRLIIGTSRDTGYKVCERFSRRPGVRYEAVVPVYRPRRDRLVPPPDVRADTRSIFRECLERFRPDWLSFIPKRRGSFRRRGFARFGLPDFYRQGYEEFLWRGAPFGVHLRRSFHDEESRRKQLDVIRACFFEGEPGEPS